MILVSLSAFLQPGRMRGILIIFFIGICFQAVSQNTLSITEENKTIQEISVTPYILYSPGPDTSKAVSFNHISDQLPFNAKHSFLLPVHNTTNDTIFRYLQFGDLYVTAIEVVYPDASGKPAFLTGPVNLIPLKIPPYQKVTVSFSYRELDRVNPDKVSPRLVTETHLQDTLYRVEVTQAFFLGLFAFLSVFNLVIYFVTGMKVYLKYTLYIISALTYFLYYYGFLQRVFPEINNLSINLVSTWYYSVYIAYFIFLNEFGQYKKYSPWAHTLLNIGLINKCIQLVCESVFNMLGMEFIYSIWYKNTILYGEIVLMCFILYFILKNKNVRGRIVITASLMLIAGAILGQLECAGPVRGYFVETGIAAELLTFSVGLGYITKLSNKEKEDAQQLYIEQLVENKKIQQTLNEQLEEKVRERTRALEKKSDENVLLLGEIHHRVKNNLQIISSLINLQSTKSKGAKVRFFLEELSNKIVAMGLVHERLYRKPEIEAVDVDQYLKDLGETIISSLSDSSHAVQFDCEFANGEAIPLEKALILGLIHNELITNSLKHARVNTKGKLKIACGLQRNDNGIHYYLKDNGAGSEKTLTADGFSLRFVEQLSQKMNGTVHYIFRKGLTVEIYFPNPLH